MGIALAVLLRLLHNAKSMLPTNKTSFYALIKGLKKVITETTTPEAVTTVALVGWMSLSCPGLSRPEHDEALLDIPEIAKFIDWLSRCEISTGAFWLSSAYTSLIEPSLRKSNAMYFTPPSLTTRLLENVERYGIPLEQGRIVDPACGGAAFLAPAAQLIARRLQSQDKSPEEILRHIETHLFGCDSSSFLCFLSDAFLHMVLADVILKAGRSPTFKIVTGDGLSVFEEQCGEFTTVLCNPPYRKMSRIELEPYLDRYKDVLKGQPNLYSLFMYRATRLLKPSGVAGLLTPMSFLSGQYFSNVRAALLKEGAVRQLDLIHEKSGVFLSAEQDTVISIWAKGANVGDTVDAFCFSSSKCERAGTLKLSGALGPWPIPRATADSELLPLFANPPAFLPDYGYASRTGSIVIHRDKRKRFLNESEAASATALVPLVWSKNIDPKGGLSIKRVAKNCVAKFIDAETFDSPCVIKKPAVAFQRVSTDDQPRRLVCAKVPDALYQQYGGVAGENHVGFLEKNSVDTPVTPELLAAVLGTETVDRLFRCISGATNVSAYELSHLPMPCVTTLVECIQKGYSLEESVRLGFGLSSRPVDAKDQSLTGSALNESCDSSSTEVQVLA